LTVEVLEDRLCPSGGYLLVDSLNTHSVLRYEEKTGAFVDALVKNNSGDLYSSVDMDFGPDHNLYVSNGHFGGQNQPKDVPAFDGATGAFLGDFVKDGQLSDPRGVIFGHDGNLYVADASNDMGSVLRFDGKTGAFLDTFVAPGTGGLGNPSGMLFGPDGDLYVIDSLHSQILRFSGATGAFLDTFVAPGSGGLENPVAFAFGPDRNLYVANTRFFASVGGGILRYNGRTGAFMDTFVAPGSGGLNRPFSVVFGPEGNLFVGSAAINSNLVARPGTSTVLRYDGKTGNLLGTFVNADSGGLRYPAALLFTETDPVTRNYVPAGEASGTSAVLATDLVQPGSSAASGALFRVTAPALENTVALTSFGQARMSEIPFLGTAVSGVTPTIQPVLPVSFGGPNLSVSLRAPTSPEATEVSNRYPAPSDADWLLEALVDDLVVVGIDPGLPRYQ
jgi:DNA-binding beta-propeller fold protein YncE